METKGEFPRPSREKTSKNKKAGSLWGRFVAAARSPLSSAPHRRDGKREEEDNGEPSVLPAEANTSELCAQAPNKVPSTSINVSMLLDESVELVRDDWPSRAVAALRRARQVACAKNAGMGTEVPSVDEDPRAEAAKACERELVALLEVSDSNIF